jgi:hypothetical protein
MALAAAAAQERDTAYYTRALRRVRMSMVASAALYHTPAAPAPESCPAARGGVGPAAAHQCVPPARWALHARLAAVLPMETEDRNALGSDGEDWPGGVELAPDVPVQCGRDPGVCALWLPDIHCSRRHGACAACTPGQPRRDMC